MTAQHWLNLKKSTKYILIHTMLLVGGADSVTFVSEEFNSHLILLHSFHANVLIKGMNPSFSS